jgi:hypothetical protein
MRDPLPSQVVPVWAAQLLVLAALEVKVLAKAEAALEILAMLVMLLPLLLVLTSLQLRGH